MNRHTSRLPMRLYIHAMFPPPSLSLPCFLPPLPLSLHPLSTSPPPLSFSLSLHFLQATRAVLGNLRNNPFPAFNTSSMAGSASEMTIFGSSINCSAVEPILEMHYAAPFQCIPINQYLDRVMSVPTSQQFSQTIDLEFSSLNCTALRSFFTFIFPGKAQCLTPDAFFASINMLILYFGIITAVVFVVGTVQVLTFQLSSERQGYKMRLAYYRAVLRQNIAWFDENSSGAITSRLSE